MSFKKGWDGVVRLFVKQKKLLIILVVVQLLFLIVVGFVQVRYQLALDQNIQDIVIPLQTANFDEAALRAGAPLLEDAAALLSAYDSLVSNAWKLIGFQFGAFVLVGLWLWVGTQYVYKKRKMVELFVQLGGRALVFLIPIGLIDYLVLRLAITEAATSAGFGISSLIAAGIVTLVGLYFMMVCLGLPDYSLRESVGRAFRVGVMKIQYTLGALVIVGVVLSVLGWLLGTFAVVLPFWGLVLLVIVFVLALVVGRVFFVGVVRAADGKV